MTLVLAQVAILVAVMDQPINFLSPMASNITRDIAAFAVCAMVLCVHVQLHGLLMPEIARQLKLDAALNKAVETEQNFSQSINEAQQAAKNITTNPAAFFNTKAMDCLNQQKNIAKKDFKGIKRDLDALKGAFLEIKTFLQKELQAILRVEKITNSRRVSFLNSCEFQPSENLGRVVKDLQGISDSMINNRKRTAIRRKMTELADKVAKIQLRKEAYSEAKSNIQHLKSKMPQR